MRKELIIVSYMWVFIVTNWNKKYIVESKESFYYIIEVIAKKCSKNV